MTDAPEAVKVPEGWKLVPMEPTPEMCRAYDYLPDWDGNDGPSPADAWTAMLAASPLSAVPAPKVEANPGLEAAREWQPIETAPKDGTSILLYCPKGDGNPGSTYRVTVGDWCEDYGGITEHRDLEGRWIGQTESEGFVGWLSWDGGFSEDTMMPTHWMPLPAPPESRTALSKLEEGE